MRRKKKLFKESNESSERFSHGKVDYLANRFAFPITVFQRLLFASPL